MDKVALLKSISALLKSVGKLCKIQHVDGSSTAAYGVVTRPSKKLAQLTSVTDETLVCYLQGNIKKPPGVGDYLKIGTALYNVEQVDRVQPDGVTTYIYSVTVRA